MTVPRMPKGDSRDEYEWLREQCPTLEDAKRFIAQWYQDGQPDVFDVECVGPGLTIRAMAHHLSWALEGKTFHDTTDSDWWGSSYMSTKYGSEIYFSHSDPVKEE